MKRIIVNTILFLFLILGIYQFYHTIIFKRKSIVSSATIIEAGLYPQRDGLSTIIYSFKTKFGKTVLAQERHRIVLSKKNELVGMRIPCAYLPEDSAASELLIYKQTWGQHNLSFPDSLKGLDKYFEKVIWIY